MEEISPQSTIPHPDQPWGVWMSLFFTTGIIIVSQLLQLGVFIILYIDKIWQNGRLASRALIEDLLLSGDVLAMGQLISTPISLILILGLCKLRPTLTLDRYLALDLPSWSHLFRWTIICLLFLACSDGLIILSDESIIPDFMRSVFESTSSYILLIIAIIFLAPLFEELLFRGFLFKGLYHSKFGSLGAVLIPAFIWTIIHLQYNIFEMGILFVGGIILGLARLKTGSVITTIIMHSIWNIVATIEVFIFYALGQ